MEVQSNHRTKDKMAVVNSHINNRPKCKWAELTKQKAQSSQMLKKQDPNICCLQETHLSSKDKCRL